MRPGRSCNQCSAFERICLLITVAGLLTAIGFAVYGITVDRFDTADSCYLFIFAVNCCFAVIYAVKGMINEDPYDLAILVLSVAPPILYVIVDYAIGHRSVLKKIRLILGVIFAPYIASFGVFYFWKFAKSKNFMTRYRVKIEVERTDSRDAIEANKQLQKCLRSMLLFYFLLSVNLQCDMSVAAFILTSGFAVDVDTWTVHHKGILVSFFAVIIIAVVGSGFGHLAVKYESKGFVIAFGVVSFCLAAAGVYLLVQAIEDLHENDNDHTLNSVALFTSVLMLFIRIITCLGCYLYYKKFGKGLMQAVNRPKDSEQSSLIPITWKDRGFTESAKQHQSTI